MKTLRSLIFVITFLFAIPAVASACFCGYRDAVEAYVGAEVVFVGKVIKIKKTERVSVGLVVKEPGTLETRKLPRWEESTDSARIITFEVVESLKGNTGQTFQIVTGPYNRGGNCALNFKVGDSYLVYATPRTRYLSSEEAATTNEWTKETEMKAGADKRNERLPNFTTSVCDRTWNMRGAHRDVDIIRLGLKNGFTEDLRREARRLDRVIEKENP